MNHNGILLIKPGSLGDVVHALPVVAALHRAWPGARLAWVIDPRWAPVLEGNPAVAERIPFDREAYRGPASSAAPAGSPPSAVAGPTSRSTCSASSAARSSPG